MNTNVQFETLHTAAWAAKNPKLRKGEPGYDDVLRKLKIGDGVTLWNDLPYFNDSDVWFRPNTHTLDLQTTGSVRLGFSAVKSSDKNVGFVLPPIPLAASTSLTISHGWDSNHGDKSGILIVAISKLADANGVPTAATEPGMTGGYLFINTDADGHMVYPPVVSPTGWTVSDVGSSDEVILVSPSTAGFYSLEVNFVGN